MLIWCKVIFFVKIFVKTEPNGKKMCTYMVGGKNNDTKINTSGLFKR